jgi:hypothetical protein
MYSLSRLRHELLFQHGVVTAVHEDVEAVAALRPGWLSGIVSR